MLDLEKVDLTVAELRRITVEFTKYSACIARVADEIESVAHEESRDEFLRELMLKAYIEDYCRFADPIREKSYRDIIYCLTDLLALIEKD